MSKITNIGYDAKRIVSNATGLGSYARTLLLSLSEERERNFFLYAPSEGRKELYNQITKKNNIVFRHPKHGNTLSKWIWRERTVVNDLLRDNIGLFHGLSGQLPCGIRQSGIKSVVTIHDLIFMRHPEWYSFFDVQIYKKKFYRSVREADRIIAISECTKRDILNLSDTEEEKIEVIYQSYNPVFTDRISEEEKQRIKKKYSLPERFILNVGTVERRKNVLLAVKALCELKNEHLVIVGRHTEYAQEVKRFIKENNLSDRVHLLGGVLFEELKVLYSLAEVFVYPSVYEGFGIPVIEAIANSLPVIACTGSCLEEAGGGDSLYVNPDDTRAMREALKVFLYDKEKKASAVAESLKYIKKFENNDVASKHLHLYDSLYGN